MSDTSNETGRREDATTEVDGTIHFSNTIEQKGSFSHKQPAIMATPQTKEDSCMVCSCTSATDEANDDSIIAQRGATSERDYESLVTPF